MYRGAGSVGIGYRHGVGTGTQDGKYTGSGTACRRSPFQSVAAEARRAGGGKPGGWTVQGCALPGSPGHVQRTRPRLYASTTGPAASVLGTRKRSTSPHRSHRSDRPGAGRPTLQTELGKMKRCNQTGKSQPTNELNRAHSPQPSYHAPAECPAAHSMPRPHSGKDMSWRSMSGPVWTFTGSVPICTINLQPRSSFRLGGVLLVRMECPAWCSGQWSHAARWLEGHGGWLAGWLGGGAR